MSELPEFHPQAEVEGGGYDVDERLVKIIGKLNSRGYRTYGSCQSYGGYLRSLGMDFNHESTRDYAYIEFWELDEVAEFLQFLKDKAGVTHEIYHRIAAEGTPNAWELKLRFTTSRFWLWFPESDIGLLEDLLER